MKYDATLKKLFQRPPNRLLSLVLGQEVVVTRTLPTELITVANLHPDLLFDTDQGLLIHTELQGYRQDNFAQRNLLYFALVLRDYGRAPVQIVFWLGPGKIGVGDGLSLPPALEYRYRLIDVGEIDGERLLESEDIGEAIFAVLCKLQDQRGAIARILTRISALPVPQKLEAVAELLILSGLRGLLTLVNEEIRSMPVSIDIHENEFLEGIFQDGREDGREDGRKEGREEGRNRGAAVARAILLAFLEQRFGIVPAEARQRILAADLDILDRWTSRLGSATSLEQILL